MAKIRIKKKLFYQILNEEIENFYGVNTAKINPLDEILNVWDQIKQTQIQLGELQKTWGKKQNP